MHCTESIVLENGQRINFQDMGVSKILWSFRSSEISSELGALAPRWVAKRIGDPTGD